jgi:hypothetical protein
MEGKVMMRIVTLAAGLVVAALAAAAAAQESKPVPKDSVRVFVPGCTKGTVFTAARRTEDQPSSVDIPEGMHLRMNGPKKVMKEIKAHEGSKIEITGLMKKGQYGPGGVSVGGVRIGPAPGPGGGVGVGVGSPTEGLNYIDVEGWRPLTGECPR